MDELALRELTVVLREARALLARPGNDFSWSSWEDAPGALAELDAVLATLGDGKRPLRLTLEVLFAPTGPMQEVSLSSGWGDEFVALAERFDRACVRAYA